MDKAALKNVNTKKNSQEIYHICLYACIFYLSLLLQKKWKNKKIHKAYSYLHCLESLPNQHRIHFMKHRIHFSHSGLSIPEKKKMSRLYSPLGHRTRLIDFFIWIYFIFLFIHSSTLQHSKIGMKWSCPKPIWQL